MIQIWRRWKRKRQLQGEIDAIRAGHQSEYDATNDPRVHEEITIQVNREAYEQIYELDTQRVRELLSKARKYNVEILSSWRADDPDHMYGDVYGERLSFSGEAKLREVVRLKFRENADWWFKTITSWLGVGFTVAALIFSYINIAQSTRNIEIAQNSLYLNAQPSLDVIFEPYKIILQNTSQYSLVDITTKIIAYSVDNQTNKIRFREDETGNEMNFAQLKSKDKIQVSNLFQVIKKRQSKEDALTKEGMHTDYSMVAIYRRETDQKKFVKVSPFILMGTEILPTIQCKGCVRWEDPYTTIQMAEEITKIEGVFFRVDN